MQQNMATLLPGNLIRVCSETVGLLADRIKHRGNEFTAKLFS